MLLILFIAFVSVLLNKLLFRKVLLLTENKIKVIIIKIIKDHMIKRKYNRNGLKIHLLRIKHS